MDCLMAVDQIRYDILVQEALRGVVRTVLTDVAKKGLPGEHHLYLSFDTRADGVRLSPRMRAQYPEEMTIVLQHQFWDLIVSQDGFEVGLSFGGIPERLAVPFSAVRGFFDPSVQFGLQFEQAGEAAFKQASENQGEATAADDRSEQRKKEFVAERVVAEPAEIRPATGPVALPGKPQTNEPSTTQESGNQESGEIVRLDRFRKK
jgi:hypothetical protein